jgi:hypothetical protein
MLGQSEYAYAIFKGDHAGGRGRNSRNRIFVGVRNDLLTGTKRTGNARDWERPAV